jgi:predicted phosphodiesterase
MGKSGPVLVVLSDTHGRHGAMKHPVPAGDILIHCGDFCGRGSLREVVDFANWFGDFPHPHKLVTAGNHDGPVEEDPDHCRALFAERGIELLLGETVVVEGYRFFGSPVTPTFFNWHFMRERGEEIRAEWEKIPDDTDVVFTHGPPSGCLELLERLRVVRPQLHLYGHIHEGYGVTCSDEIPGTTFINASTCTEQYRPDNAPWRGVLSR